MLREMSRSNQYERRSLLAVKNSHKTVGCFLHFINGPADDLQYRCGVKILLHHGRLAADGPADVLLRDKALMEGNHLELPFCLAGPPSEIKVLTP